MSDKTVEEIMALADKYVDYCEGHTARQQDDVREALRDAITALAAERDQLQSNLLTLIDADGMLNEAAVTTNILRIWPREQTRRFAEHLLGDERDQAVKQNAEMLDRKNAQLAETLTELKAVTEQRDQAVRKASQLDKCLDVGVQASQSQRQDFERLKALNNKLIAERDALAARVAELEKAIAATPETYQYVEDDDCWHGQQFCFFCGGEMASQMVNHKQGCVRSIEGNPIANI